MASTIVWSERAVEDLESKATVGINLTQHFDFAVSADFEF